MKGPGSLQFDSACSPLSHQYLGDANMQQERPVANRPDDHRFDDWTSAVVADLAATLPNDDDRRRFLESVVRAGVLALHGDLDHLSDYDPVRAAHDAKVDRGT
jgi:hypothetical protein